MPAARKQVLRFAQDDNGLGLSKLRHYRPSESLDGQPPSASPQLFRVQFHQDSPHAEDESGYGCWRDGSTLERREFGSPLGRLRAAEGGKSGVNPTHRVIYEICKAGIILLPAFLGAYMFFSACVGYGKPPVKWYIRLLVGAIGLLFMFPGIRQLISK